MCSSWVRAVTGKELAANAVHAQSPRVEAPGEDQLRPPSPGSDRVRAVRSCQGRLHRSLDGQAGPLEEAHRGSLLLDEITEMRLIAAKLLRVLEDRTVRGWGGGKDGAVDFRSSARRTSTDESQSREGHSPPGPLLPDQTVTVRSRLCATRAPTSGAGQCVSWNGSRRSTARVEGSIRSYRGSCPTVPATCASMEHAIGAGCTRRARPADRRELICRRLAGCARHARRPPHPRRVRWRRSARVHHPALETRLNKQAAAALLDSAATLSTPSCRRTGSPSAAASPVFFSCRVSGLPRQPSHPARGPVHTK